MAYLKFVIFVNVGVLECLLLELSQLAGIGWNDDPRTLVCEALFQGMADSSFVGLANSFLVPNNTLEVGTAGASS